MQTLRVANLEGIGPVVSLENLRLYLANLTTMLECADKSLATKALKAVDTELETWERIARSLPIVRIR